MALEPKHISFYLLTLSRRVPLYASKHLLPEEEEAREMYLFASEFLRENGFDHYEVSNAARPGFRSRHNSVYWNGGDYLGIGPGAFSLLNRTRFCMLDGVEEFINAKNALERLSKAEVLEHCDYFTEYVMLSLRTKEGVSFERIRSLSNEAFEKRAREKSALWQKHGLCTVRDDGFSLTPEGFFVSNEMIIQLL